MLLIQMQIKVEYHTFVDPHQSKKNIKNQDYSIKL
jgi:hypothetical protein